MQFSASLDLIQFVKRQDSCVSMKVAKCANIGCIVGDMFDRYKMAEYIIFYSLEIFSNGLLMSASSVEGPVTFVKFPTAFEQKKK